MNLNDIYIKTPAGIDEVKGRSRQLAPRVRSMLIMIDGALTVERLRHAAATLGAPEQVIEQLEELGLIVNRRGRGESAPQVQPQATAPADARTVTAQQADSDAERFRAGLKFMNDSAVDVLKLRAFFFTLKLERCYSLADLRALLPAFRNAVARSAGPELARDLEARARDLLDG